MKTFTFLPFGRSTHPHSLSLLIQTPFVFSFVFMVTLFVPANGIALEATEEKLIVLGLGREHKLIIPRLEKVRVGNGDPIKITDRGRYLQLFARRTGEAILNIGSQRYRIRVLNNKKFQVYDRLRQTMKEMKGISLYVAEGARIQVLGELWRWSDWQRLAQAVGNGNYEFLASIHPSIQEYTHQQLIRLARGKGLVPPQITLPKNQSASLSTSSDKLLETYVSLFSPYGLSVEHTPSLVHLQPMIRVNIYITEIRKSTALKWGLQLPNSYQAQLVPTIGNDQTLLAQLRLLENKGKGRILASPNLLCRSGDTADFLAGGEFPIKVMGLTKKQVVWKPYGVILKVSPKADELGHMSISLQTEISTIDRSQMIDDIPGLLTNRMASHFNLTRSQTIALSGLIKKESGHNQSGWPGLQSLPILGKLFSSHDYLQNHSEMVIFVTPEIVPPTAQVTHLPSLEMEGEKN